MFGEEDRLHALLASQRRGALRLVEEVDRAVREHRLDARSAIADAALDLAGELGYEMGTATYDPSIPGLQPKCPSCGAQLP